MSFENILVLAGIAAIIVILWWVRPALDERDSRNKKEPPLL